jgi:hypothetical protein
VAKTSRRGHICCGTIEGDAWQGDHVMAGSARRQLIEVRQGAKRPQASLETHWLP